MTLVLANNICVVNKRFVNYRTNNINSLQGMGKRQEISFDFYWAHGYTEGFVNKKDICI